MATTVRGTAILKWGTYTLAGYIVNESEITNEGGTEMLDNEDGQFVTHFTNFALKETASVVFVPLTGTAAPTVDALLTYNGIARPVISWSRVNNKRGVEIWRLQFERIPGVTYS